MAQLSMYLQRRMGEIEEENELLRQRVHALETALGVLDQVPAQFRLTRSETKIFGALMRWPICTKEAVEAALYDDEKRTSMYALLMTLRRKLRPHGIEIETVHGQGWGLSVAAKKMIQGMIARALPDT
jgi:hypothetical protein